jgi:hypothetical protein
LFLLMKVVHHFCPQKPAAKFWSKQQDPQVLSQVSKLPTFVEWMYYKKLVMAKLLATQFFLVLLLSFVAILGQVLIWGTPQLLGHYPAHKCCPNKHTQLSFYFSLDLEGSPPREELQGQYAIGRWTTYFYMFPCSHK